MLESKLIELRDRATFIPMIALRPSHPQSRGERYLLARAGFGRDIEAHERYVFFMRADCGQAEYDPHKWSNPRAYGVAHQYVIDHWEELEDGSVVDVEFILGETAYPKGSECDDYPVPR